MLQAKAHPEHVLRTISANHLWTNCSWKLETSKSCCGRIQRKPLRKIQNCEYRTLQTCFYLHVADSVLCRRTCTSRRRVHLVVRVALHATRTTTSTHPFHVHGSPTAHNHVSWSSSSGTGIIGRYRSRPGCKDPVAMPPKPVDRAHMISSSACIETSV